jgi:predicted RNA-binding protein with PIN domain
LPTPTLFLFDGSNLFHAGHFADRETLVDLLASFVAAQGARGVVAFDGHGQDAEIGALAIRFVPDADALLERLAAQTRGEESVQLVTSDTTIRTTSGQDVRKRTSERFLAELVRPAHADSPPSRVAERLDPETRRRLEELRRGG